MLQWACRDCLSRCPYARTEFCVEKGFRVWGPVVGDFAGWQGIGNVGTKNLGFSSPDEL